MRRHTEVKARDLKPCPFCGAAAAVERDKHGVIESVDCSAICDLQHPTSVDWNSRPVEDALRARVEAAEAEIVRLGALYEAALAEGEAAGAARERVATQVELDDLRARADAAEARAETAEAVMRGLVAVYDGERQRQKAAIAAEADARVAAAEARAVQAEADARLMLTALVDLDESVGTNVVMCWRGLGLTDAECDALWSRFARTSTEVEQRELEALRRILATAGAT